MESELRIDEQMVKVDRPSLRTSSSRTAHMLSVQSLALPAAILLVVGFLLPVCFLVGSALRYDRQVVSIPVLLRVEWTTMKISAIVGTAVTVVGTCIALLIRSCHPFQQRIILALSVFPLGVNIAFRVFGVQVTIATAEVIGAHFHIGALLGRGESNLLFTQTATIIGLVHWLFPVAVLILFSAVQNIRQDLTDSAALLGAPGVSVLLRVMLPSIASEIFLCFALTFCLAYGAYITPAALGGLGDITLSRLIGGLLNDGQAQNATIPALIGMVTPVAVFAAFAFLVRKLAYGTKSGI